MNTSPSGFKVIFVEQELEAPHRTLSQVESALMCGEVTLEAFDKLCEDIREYMFGDAPKTRGGLSAPLSTVELGEQT